MNHSLHEACAQFEQVMLAGMLQTAGFGRAMLADADADDDTNPSNSAAASDLEQHVFIVALSGAIERAGGIGFAQFLERSGQAGR